MDKAILVAVNDQNLNLSEEIEELKSLCYACGIEIIDEVIQNLDRPNPTTYVGKGKLEEVKIALNSHEVTLVITNDELSPAQISTLEKQLDCDVFDRTFIILEIFRRRAQTKEALLQVELAIHKYQLPRLVGSRKGLSRQRGTGGGFARGRGAGEMKLELERREIYDRMAFIKRELANLTKLRKQQRVKRKKNEMKTVALVGYTNSGKSSTLNGLLKYSILPKKEVFEKDMLFATLETATRAIKTKNNLNFLLTDTVGFVNKLPHQLIEAFKSTLEEIKEAHLIVHVVDAANPKFEEQVKTTNQVLKEIGIKDIPMIYAFNKIDLVNGSFYIPPEYSNAITISATNDINLDKLLDFIEENLFKSYYEVEIKLPYEKSNLINTIRENAIIINYEETPECYLIKAKLPDYLFEQLKDYIEL
ncbi:MAG TPA: GTPase HflX [Acholeplasmataceae bacterium]|nr:GTPase HflX [Acholeplasmataceae bacterium]